jgi:hypothetical protein
MEEKYIVKLYDGFDNEWITIGENLSYNDAQKLWNEKTNNGTRKTSYNDIDYYKIFKMV